MVKFPVSPNPFGPLRGPSPSLGTTDCTCNAQASAGCVTGVCIPGTGGSFSGASEGGCGNASSWGFPLPTKVAGSQTSLTQNALGGTGLTAWQILHGVASINLSGFGPGSATTEYLMPGFAPNIPANAIVIGVEFQLQIALSGGTGLTLTDSTVSLYSGGALIGASKAGNSMGISTVTWAYGGSADMWGAPLTPAIVNSLTPAWQVTYSISAAGNVQISPSNYSATVYYLTAGTSVCAGPVRP